MVDEYGRTINYIRISITDRCNLRCRYCMPKDGVQLKNHSDIMTYEEILFFISRLGPNGIDKVRITGGEPLLRRGVTEFVKNCVATKGIREVNLTTNGILLPKYAKQLSDAGLHSINLSLDTLDRERYAQITRGGDVQQALDGLHAALLANIPVVKINCVATKSVLSELDAFMALIKDKQIYLRFIELMPLGEGKNFTGAYVSTCDIINHIDGLHEAEDVFAGPAKYYAKEGYAGKIGFISAMSHSFCARCNRIRLTSTGQLIPCLNSSDTVDIRQYTKLKDAKGIDESLQLVLRKKPASHNFETNALLRNMNEVGG